MWQSCEKRRDGKRLYSTNLISITQPLYFVGSVFIASEHGSVGECACV